MILIIDYGMGNLRSVAKAFESLGAQVLVSADPNDLTKADKIVLPGVGSFDHAVRELKKRCLFEPLKEAIQTKPYLGLCLGLQLLFRKSEEGKEEGLGIFEGTVKRFPAQLKVPHMGWNQVTFKSKDCPLWKSVPNESFFYFVHSFYATETSDGIEEGSTDYGVNFVSAVWKQKIFATQFHPEKSQKWGLQILKNFIEVAS
jgi:imidazole glycerol-phosphate synthase subunit HisH